MKKDLPIQTKVNVAFNSIDHIEPAVPSPYFYRKVLAKINNGKPALWEKWSAFFLHPAVALAAICLIIVVNAFVLFSTKDNPDFSSDQTELAATDEYNESITALYDLENVKP